MANALNKITTKSILDDTVATSDIADDAVTLAKMAAGTDGQIITYDASGNPVAVGPGTDGQVLTSTGAGSPPAFESIPTQISLTGSTNNTICTVTGANAIQGEANLTFDGSTLGVTGDVTMTNTSSNPQLALISANDGTCEIQFGDGNDAVRGNILYKSGSAGDALCFNGYNNTERMRIDSSGHVLPGADNTQDLGSSTKRWANVYSGDLQLSNEGSANEVDGTWGNFTIQEGEDDLFLINRRNGKKYKFNLTEVN